MQKIKEDINFIVNRFLEHMTMIGIIVFLLLFIPYFIMGLFSGWFNLSNILSLFCAVIAYWTLFATIRIALYIYDRQKEDSIAIEEQKWETAKDHTGAAIDDSLNSLIMGPSNCETRSWFFMRECYKDYKVLLSKKLSPSQMEVFSQMVETMNEADSFIKANDVLYLFREWIRPIMSCDDYNHLASYANNRYDLLCKDAYTLLQSLAVEGTESSFKDFNIINDSEGRILFEQTDNIHQYAKDFINTVYDIYKDSDFFVKVNIPKVEHRIEDELPSIKGKVVNIFNVGNLIFSGELGYDDIAIDAGYIHTELYEGFVKEGEYSGPGILYNKEHQKIKEGFWQEGDLLAGIEYKHIFKDVNNSEWDNELDDFKEGEEPKLVELFDQYDNGEDYPFKGELQEDMKAIKNKGFEGYYMADKKIMGTYDLIFNIKPLKDFMQQQDVKLLDSLVKEIYCE